MAYLEQVQLRKKSSTSKRRSKLSYYNCGELDHFNMECTKPRNVSRNIQNFSSRFSNRTSFVLYELLLQLDANELNNFVFEKLDNETKDNEKDEYV